MGDRDPEIARVDAPTSLRALYGLSLQQNGLMGSPDIQTAEIQIESLFASSPIYPTQDLPEELSSPAASTQFPPSSLTAQIMETLQRNAPNARQNQTSSATTLSSPGTQRSRVDSKGKPVFRARAVPTTNTTPDISPRTTRAAALRAGIDISPSARGPRVAPTREQQKLNFLDVPGHKRSSTIQVASTQAPAIAPRMTKAAALRLGIKPEPPRVRAVSATNAGSLGTQGSTDTFEGVPGHKRRESISVLSTKPPTMGPRLNKSAALRAEKDKAPPTSFQCKLSFVGLRASDFLTRPLCSPCSHSSYTITIRFYFSSVVSSVFCSISPGAGPCSHETDVIDDRPHTSSSYETTDICTRPCTRFCTRSSARTSHSCTAFKAQTQQFGGALNCTSAEQERAATSGQDGGGQCPRAEGRSQGTKGLGSYHWVHLPHPLLIYSSERWPPFAYMQHVHL